MKIAILGKGGSGKSSISWLLSNYISTDLNLKTLAIDGDHNMDLTSNFGIDEGKINYLKNFNSQFRTLSGMPEKGMWKEYFNHQKIMFEYPNDPKLVDYCYNIKPNLELMVVGLGDIELMNYNVCSHGVSASLKYMLPTLTLKDNAFIVYDSVAGVDMLNYGLYFGFDTLIVVVEGNINSIKVANQIKNLANIQGINVQFLLNKYSDSNTRLLEFEQNNNIIGRINSDSGIENYDYKLVSNENKIQLKSIISSLQKSPFENPFSILKEFELSKK
jgi:CO dehydrogenase maturation factor